MSIRPSVLFASATLVAAASLFAFARPEPAPTPTPVAGWEYLIVRGGVDIAASPKDQDAQVAGMQGTLNNLGNEGWELAAVQGQFAVLKRPR
jgi:hypothetical protein